MTNTNSEDEKSGACRRCDAHLEAHHRLITERHNHDTLRRVCCSFAVRRDFESGVFQGANRLPGCIVAYLTVGLLCFFAAVGFGAETPVQMATLRWSGDGEVRSWRWEKLGEAFEDGAARFAAESRIVSPTWAELDVLGAEVALRCSTNAPSRFLQVSFLRDGKVVSGPIRFEAVFAANSRESQSLAVSRAKHANGIVLSLSGGEVGDWGVYEVHLTTEPTTYVPPKKGFMVIIK